MCKIHSTEADCGTVYAASMILALSSGQLMWKVGADWCVQLCTAAGKADLCETMLLVFPGLHSSRKRERESIL